MNDEQISRQIRKDKNKSIAYFCLSLLSIFLGLFIIGQVVGDVEELIESPQTTLTKCKFAFFILAILVTVFISGIFFWTAQLKPGRNIDPLNDNRPPFLFSHSFRDVSLTFFPPTPAVFTEPRTHVIFPGDSLIKSIDKSLYAYGQSILFSRSPVINPDIGFPPMVRDLDEGMQDFITLDDYSDSWFNAFFYIAIHSRAIFVFPATTEGALREMIEITNSDLLDRTLVVMPPTLEMSTDESRFKSGWQDIQNKLRKTKGFRLPTYLEGGMIYVPARDFSVKKCFLLEGDIDKVVKAIPELLPSDNMNSLPLSEILNELVHSGFISCDSKNRWFRRT
jgi:hypothetical protein